VQSQEKHPTFFLEMATNHKSSRGLTTPCTPCFNTWVYIMVVSKSLWPSKAWMVRISVPRCSKCLVKLYRNVCVLTFLVISVWRTACFIALLIADWSRWWRCIIQLRESFGRPRTGNTYCGVLDLRLIGINLYIHLISCSSSTNQANLSEYSIRG
jgi:hypothetical protein